MFWNFVEQIFRNTKILRKKAPTRTRQIPLAIHEFKECAIC